LEAKDGYRLADVSPDAKLPAIPDFGLTELGVIETFIKRAEEELSRRLPRGQRS